MATTAARRCAIGPDDGGLDVGEQLLWIFQREVAWQSQFALLAASDLQLALGVNDSRRIWQAVQGLLVAVGNISKLLWPARDADTDIALRTALRESLDVADDSVLAPRTFRNHFEHFDERLESWARTTKHRNIVDTSVLAPGSIVGLDQGDFLRNLDPTTLKVTFRGDEYALKPVVEAVEDLYVRAKAYEMPPCFRQPPMG
jgi:hypothetical protein